MRMTALLLLAALPLWAQLKVEGRLTNGSGEGPGKADVVQLVALQQSMQVLAVAENVEGDFVLEAPGAALGGQYLVQAQVGPAIYSAKVGEQDGLIEIEVFENADEVEIKALHRPFALSVSGNRFIVGGIIDLMNVSDPAKTLVREGSTFRFPIIADLEDVEVSTQSGSLPLRQAVTVEGNMASITYPLKPGKTQLMYRGSLPYNPSVVNTYRLPLYGSQKQFYLLAMPMSLKVEADGLDFSGTDEQQGLALYEYERQENQEFLEIRVSGTGEEENAAERRQSNTRQAQGEVKVMKHPLSEYVVWIVGSTFAILALFLVVGLKR